MAGNGNKRAQKQQGRVGPSVDTGKSSRVSRAAGGAGSSSLHAEQRSSSSSAKQRTQRPQGSSASGTSGTSSRSNGQVPARRAQGNKQTPKKGGTNRPAPGPGPIPAAPTADARLINSMRAKWASMEPHHQQRFFGFLLLGLSVVLFLALTVWHATPIFKPLADFFLRFFDWSAYLLALGLIVFSIAHLIEGMRNIRFIRWSLVVGLLALLLLLLAESQLLFGSTTGGIMGGLLASPLLKWGFPAHVLIFGVFVIVAFVTFRITFGHMAAAARFVSSLFVDRRGDAASVNTGGPSPFLGQRPQYSRYVGQAALASNAGSGGSAPGRKERGNTQLAELDEEDEDEESPIDFEDDFDSEDDPLNDINIHKQQVGSVPRGARPVQPFDREEHRAAVQGARQQPLPFDNVKRRAQADEDDEMDEMEPLRPKPQPPQPPQQSSRLPKIFTRAAKPEPESAWKLPDSAILNSPEEVKLHMMGDDTVTLAKTIQDTLRSFRVEAEVRPEDISIGPTVIRFGIRPTGKPAMKEDEKGRQVPIKDAAGNIIYETRTRVSRIMALQNDLALVLESKTIRMEAPVPGRPYVGVEIPNKNSRLVTLREVLESKEYQTAKARSKLTVALGKDVAGAVRIGDLSKMPHLLIAGATGAGKSVCINVIIGSILTQATPEDVRMLMVDPKMVELSMYNGIPHLLSPVVTEVERVVGLLKIAIAEMEKRYRLFSQLGVRNLDGYRKLRAERIKGGDNTLNNLPAIVIIIDELADLMMAAPEEVEGLICRLAQLARATGIHLVVATQRPSVDVITGLIKANIPTRISFMVSSAVDSRTIIDMGGAERLLGRGDMLYLPADAGKPERIQGAFVADDEADRLVTYWRQQATDHAAAIAAAEGKAKDAAVAPAVEPGWEVSERVSDDFELEDDLLEQAEQVVQEYERASISLLQRRLRIGYSRAARLIDLLEERGVIGRSEPGGRSREVYDKRPTRYGGGEGRTMADEAADIIAEEKMREEFLKKQKSKDEKEET